MSDVIETTNINAYVLHVAARVERKVPLLRKQAVLMSTFAINGFHS